MTQTFKPIESCNHVPGFEVFGGTRHEAPASAVAIGARMISTVFGAYRGDIGFRLWDGRLAAGRPGAACDIVMHDPGVPRETVLYRSLSRLARAYLDGRLSVIGDMEALFDLETYLKTLRLPWSTRCRLIGLALRLPAHRGKSAPTPAPGRVRCGNGRDSIAHHYDVGNAFYALWLDPRMVYSCAYFHDARQSLAAAQWDKLDYLCRKLRLQPGQSLLDIGCGWGALAIHAARHHGVRVRGITLSEAQQQVARQRVRAEGLDRRVRIELCDYRDLGGSDRYDRVVSVGMFEHVGIKHFPLYFATVKRVLKPEGLFLNHGITSETGWQRTPLTRFINQYIFPDGELARFGEVAVAMEKAGFEIHDVESLRRHYVHTLRRWVQALESKRDEAISLTSEITYRLWRLYMAGSAHYFDEGSLGVYQLLVGHRHAPTVMPLRRDKLYVRHESRCGTREMEKRTRGNRIDPPVQGVGGKV